jgi:hypothetical protein
VSVTQGEDGNETKYTETCRWKHIDSMCRTGRQGEREREIGDVKMILLKLRNKAMECD